MASTFTPYLASTFRRGVRQLYEHIFRMTYHRQQLRDKCWRDPVLDGGMATEQGTIVLAKPPTRY